MQNCQLHLVYPISEDDCHGLLIRGISLMGSSSIFSIATFPRFLLFYRKSIQIQLPESFGVAFQPF